MDPFYCWRLRPSYPVINGYLFAYGPKWRLVLVVL